MGDSGLFVHGIRKESFEILSGRQAGVAWRRMAARDAARDGGVDGGEVVIPVVRPSYTAT